LNYIFNLWPSICQAGKINLPEAGGQYLRKKIPQFKKTNPWMIFKIKKAVNKKQKAF
jgi:hypothetical protein